MSSSQNTIGRLVVNGFNTGDNAIINFVNLTQQGPAAFVRLYFTFKLLSTDAAFNLLVDSPDLGIEGADDVDIWGAGVFSRWVLYLSSDLNTFSVLTPELRTIIAMLTRRDFLGTFTQSNGVQVPASNGAAKQFSVDIRIPVSLQDYFADGAITTMGTYRMKTGSLTMQGLNLTPTLALNNGDAVVSAMTVESQVFFGIGEAGDVGATWRYERTSGQPSIYVPKSDSLYLGSLDIGGGPVETNASTYNRLFDTEGPLDAPLLGSRYQIDQVFTGGNLADLTGRCTPLDWVRNRETLDDMIPRLTRRRVIDVSGQASLTVADFHLYAAEPRALADMALNVGGGGAVHTMKLRAPSMPIGSKPAPQIANLLPTRVRAGAAPVTPAVKTAAGPNAAANQARNANARANRRNKIDAQLKR